MFKQTGKKGKGANNYSVKDMLDYLESLTDPDQVADLVSCALLQGPQERQTILETVELEPRLKRLIHYLMAEVKRPRKQG